MRTLSTSLLGSTLLLLAPARAVAGGLAPPGDAVSPAEAAPCSDQPEASLREALDIALEAYARLDPELFGAAERASAQHLGCLERPLAPDEVADLHLVRGLGAWLRRDEAELVACMRGLAAVQPDLALPEELAPPSGAVAQALAEARGAQASPETPLPVEGLVVDGRAGLDQVPVGRVCLVQAPDSEGALRTWYLDGGELPADLLALSPAPSAQLAAPSGPVAAPENILGGARAPQPTTRAGHPSRGLAAGGLACAALAGGAAVAALRTQDAFWSAGEQAEAERAYRLNRAAGMTTYGSAALSGGLMLGAALVWRW